MSLPYMSTFLFRGALICEWRDYFDLQSQLCCASSGYHSTARGRQSTSRPHERGPSPSLVRPRAASARGLRPEAAARDARGARHPDRRLALFEDGSSWSWGECLAEVRAAAAGLQRLGVKKGDRVLAWLPTGKPMVLTWFAANYLGAVFVPLDTAYRGAVLQHVVNAAGAAVMVNSIRRLSSGSRVSGWSTCDR